MKGFHSDRRTFLSFMTTTAATAALDQTRPNTAQVVPRKISPNETLNIACIGVGGMGQTDVFNVRQENIVALCDVDSVRAKRAFDYFEAPKFTDYRKMLDNIKDIDAVVVSTPDHTHAPAAYRAMMMGKHVYVQKPLTHTIAETYLLHKTAKETGVATQMGNQGHSNRGTRELCEMIWSDAIGPVREVHAWTFRPQGKWPQGITAPLPAMNIPDHLDWDCWLGTGKDRPYNSGYCPRNWRGWYDFGNGALGDMGCHVLDAAFWSLKLMDAPQYTIEIVESAPRNDYTFPKRQVLKYSFPQRGDLPPVNVYWYDGSALPPWPKGVPNDQEIGHGKWPEENDGSYFVGDKGLLTAGTYGTYPRLLPDERMADYAMPDPWLPRIEKNNHYQNWIDACKGGEAACSNFDYAAPLTIMVLLGGVAMRAGQKVAWDNQKQTITNLPNAGTWLTKAYRVDWELPL